MDLLSSIGSSNGHFSDKENRAQKLIDNWQYLHEKMCALVQRGNGTTEKARCAYAVLLMMETGIRVGNESSAEGYVPTKTEYVVDNGKYVPVRKYNDEGEYVVQRKYARIPDRYIRIDGRFIHTKSYKHETVNTYGLTTLKKEHVRMGNGTLHIVFIGKKAVQQNLKTSHPILVSYAKPIYNASEETFLGIDYPTLYAFIKSAIGKQFKPKDIRTAVVNRKFIDNVNNSQKSLASISKKGDAKKYVSTIIEKTAEQIGHTKGVCKSSYVSKRLYSKVLDIALAIAERNKKGANK